jgi:hypothetical protein
MPDAPDALDALGPLDAPPPPLDVNNVDNMDDIDDVNDVDDEPVAAALPALPISGESVRASTRASGSACARISQLATCGQMCWRTRGKRDTRRDLMNDPSSFPST